MGSRNTRFVSSLWITFCATGLLGASAASSDESFRPQDYFVSPDQADMPDLANRWWQWVYSNPDLPNPRKYLSGAHCSAPQSGDVWFLADAETSDRVERKCQMPFGKDIFFPVINNIMWTPPGVEQSCEEVKEAVAFDRSPNYSISVSLNGTPFPNPGSHLVGSSECFDLLARIQERTIRPATIRLQPMAIGSCSELFQ